MLCMGQLDLWRIRKELKIGRVSGVNWDLPDGSNGKESACNAGDPGLIPGFGRSPGEGNDYSL